MRLFSRYSELTVSNARHRIQNGNAHQRRGKRDALKRNRTKLVIVKCHIREERLNQAQPRGDCDSKQPCDGPPPFAAVQSQVPLSSYSNLFPMLCASSIE